MADTIPRPCVICGSMLEGHTPDRYGCRDVKR